MPLISKNAEYETLRAELNQSKKYILERPLIITGVAVAVLGIDKGIHLMGVPPVVIALLTFNLWFTINRLRSCARIVGYISSVLESSNEDQWIGWESSLLKFREICADKDAMKQVDEKLEGIKSADALMFYGAIYTFHWALVIMATVTVIVMAFIADWVDITNAWIIVISCLATALAFFWFVRYALEHKPSRFDKLINWNVFVWDLALPIQSTNGQ